MMSMPLRCLLEVSEGRWMMAYVSECSMTRRDMPMYNMVDGTPYRDPSLQGESYELDIRAMVSEKLYASDLPRAALQALGRPDLEPRALAPDPDTVSTLSAPEPPVAEPDRPELRRFEELEAYEKEPT